MSPGCTGGCIRRNIPGAPPAGKAKKRAPCNKRAGIASLYAEAISTRKDVCHLIDWLKANADVEEIDYESSFFRSFKKYAPINVKNSIANLRSNVPPEEYEFVAFKLLDTERNREYNITLADTHSPYTYVYFELKTGYFDSSSCKLAMELTIEQGLDDDADENSPEYMHYAATVRLYNAHEFDRIY